MLNRERAKQTAPPVRRFPSRTSSLCTVEGLFKRRLFIRFIEAVLKANHKPGLFEPPRAWDIKAGTTAGLDEVFT